MTSRTENSYTLRAVPLKGCYGRIDAGRRRREGGEIEDLVLPVWPNTIS
jgi:hypothetical protein